MLFIPIQLLTAFLFFCQSAFVGQSADCKFQCCDVHAMALVFHCIQCRSRSFKLELQQEWKFLILGSFFQLSIIFVLLILSPGDCCFFQPSLGTLHLKNKIVRPDAFGLTAWPDYLSHLGHADIAESEEPCPARVILAASSISLPGMSLVMFCASRCQTPMNFFVVFTYHIMTFQ